MKNFFQLLFLLSFIGQQLSCKRYRNLYSKTNPKLRQKQILRKQKQFQAKQKNLKLIPGFKVINGKIKTQKPKIHRSRANTLANKLYNSLNNTKNYKRNKLNNKKLFSKKNFKKNIQRYSLSKQAQFYNIANQNKKLNIKNKNQQRNKKFSRSQKLIKKMNANHSLYQRYLKQKQSNKKIKKIEVKNMQDFLPIDDTDLEHLTKHLNSQESSKPVLLNLDLAHPKIDWGYLNEEKESIEFIQKYNDHHYNILKSKEILEKLLQILMICKQKASYFYESDLTYSQILTDKLKGCPTVFIYTLEIIDKIQKWTRNIIYNYIITNGNLIKVQKYIDYYYLSGNMLKDKELLTFGTFKQAVINSEGKSFNFDDYKILYKTQVEYILNFYHKVFMSYYPSLLFVIKMTTSRSANRILCEFTTNMKFLESFNKIYSIFMRLKNQKPKIQTINKKDAKQFEKNVFQAYSSSSIDQKNKKLSQFDAANTAKDLQFLDINIEDMQDIKDNENKDKEQEGIPSYIINRDPRRYTDGQEEDLVFINGELLNEDQLKIQKKREEQKKKKQDQFDLDHLDNQGKMVQELFGDSSESSEELEIFQTLFKNSEQVKDQDQNTQKKSDQLQNQDDKQEDQNQQKKNKDQKKDQLIDNQLDDKNVTQEDKQNMNNTLKNNQEVIIDPKENFSSEDDNKLQNQENGIKKDEEDNLSLINLFDQKGENKIQEDSIKDQQTDLIKDEQIDINGDQKQDIIKNKEQEQRKQINNEDLLQLDDTQLQNTQIDDNKDDNILDLNKQIPTLEDQNSLENLQKIKKENLQNGKQNDQNKINQTIKIDQDEQKENQFNKNKVDEDQLIDQNQLDQQKQNDREQSRMNQIQNSIVQEENEIEKLKNEMQQKDYKQNTQSDLPVVSDDDYLFTKEEIRNNFQNTNKQILPENKIEQIEHQDFSDLNFIDQEAQDKFDQKENMIEQNFENNQIINQNQQNISKNNQNIYTQGNNQKDFNTMKPQYDIDKDDNYNFGQKQKPNIQAIYINNVNSPNSGDMQQPNSQIQITLPNNLDCQNYQIYHYENKQDCQDHKNRLKMKKII